MIDRQSGKPGRIKLTFEDGTVKYATMERADEPVVDGTPINKSTLFNNDNELRYAALLPSEAFARITQEPVAHLPSSGWSSDTDKDGFYTQTIPINGMSEQFSPIFSLVVHNAESSYDEEGAFAFIKKMSTLNGYVTFKATAPLAIDIDVKLKGV